MQRGGGFFCFCFCFCFFGCCFFLYHINVKCMSIFLKAGPLPWASQAIHWAAHFYSAMVCYTPQSAPSTGSVCVCVCVCVSVCVRACASQSCVDPTNSHFKTRALVWNLAQFVKNVKEQKKTFKAHRLVSTFPYICSLLIVFNDLLFSLVAILIFIMYSFLYIIDRSCVSMWVFSFWSPECEYSFS